MSTDGDVDDQLILGAVVFAKFRGKRKFENRLLLSHIQEKEFMALAPDGSLSAEDFGKVSQIFFNADDLPQGAARSTVLFDALPTADEFNALMDTANGERDEILASREVAAAAPQSVDFKAIARQRRSGLPRADTQPITSRPDSSSKTKNVQPIAPTVSGGLGALAAALGVTVPPTSKEPDDVEDDHHDARVLPPLYDSNGQRFRAFKEGVDRCLAAAWPDWPVPGPRTALWVLKWMVARGGGPLAWHAQWKSNGKLTDADPWVIQHESSCRVLETCICYDQVNGASLACIELVCRNIQIAEDVLSHKFQDNHSDHATDLFLMSGASHRSQLCICPDLKAYTAAETAKESAVLKERRKAREERILAMPKKGAPKGGKQSEGS